MSHNWSSWNDHQSSSWSQWSSYRSPLPSSWKPDDTHHDSHLVHGYPLFRTIQPTAWTRKKGIHGLDPLEIPVHQLCRYGLQEFSLRPLSAGRFVGLVCTRSVAESVFTAQLLKALRENAIDVDSIAEHLHQTASSTQSTPSKNDQPPASGVHRPGNSGSGHKAKSFTVTKDRKSSDSTCTGLRSAAQRGAGPIGGSRSFRTITRPSSSPKPTPKRSPSSAPLGSTPKRKARKIEETSQQKLSQMFPPSEVSAPSVPTVRTNIRRPQGSIFDADVAGSILSVPEILNASSPVLKQYQPGGFSAATIKKWFQTFPTETQQPAQKIIQILNDSGVSKTDLQQAAIQYGLPMDFNVHQIVAIGASLTA